MSSRDSAIAISSHRLPGPVRPPVDDIFEDLEHLLVAGQSATAGRYRRVDVSWGAVIELAHGDLAPASFDGSVAVYEKLPAVARMNASDSPIPIRANAPRAISLLAG